MASTSSNQGEPEVIARIIEVSNALTGSLQVLDVDYKQQQQSTISKIPHDVREGNGDAYDPRLISIGPYHHGKEALEPMQQIKLLYLQQLLSRGERVQLEDYVKAIAVREEDIRKQYSESLSDLNSKKFLGMLVLDGCFMVEILLKHFERFANLPMTTSIRNMPLLLRDLLLLENQIPFFVLDAILEASEYRKSSVFSDLFFECHGMTLIDLALFYLHKGRITKKMLHVDEVNIYHLLHLEYLCGLTGLQLTTSPMKGHPPADTLFVLICNQLMVSISITAYGWSFLLKKIKRFFRLLLIGIVYVIILSIETLILWKKPNWFNSNCKRSSSLPTRFPRGHPGLSRPLPTAMQLDKAGMMLRKKEYETSFLDVSFNDGNLEIPLLPIDRYKKSYFENILALEQSFPVDTGYHYSSYVVLMTNLIKTTSDVALLRDRGIIQNSIGGDEDVVKIFNRLDSVTLLRNNKHHLGGVFEAVEEHYNQHYHRWRARIMNDYLDHPKVAFALIGALIIIGLTTVQTAFTIINK